jgi:hypothetical protein
MTMSTQLKIILDSFNRLKEQKNPSSLEKISNLANLLWSQHLNKLKEEYKDISWDFFDALLEQSKKKISNENYFIDFYQEKIIISKNKQQLLKTVPYNPKEMKKIIFEETNDLLELLLHQKEIFLLLNLHFQINNPKEQELNKITEEEI